MEAAAAYWLVPFDALLFGAPWYGQELALLGLLPGAVLHRHPLLRVTGAMVGYSLAIFACLTFAPVQDARWFLLEPDVYGALAAFIGPMPAYGAAIWLASDDTIEREREHLRALRARVQSWATGRPSPLHRKGDEHVG